MTRNELGLRLRFARERAGIKQYQAGYVLGVDGSTINKIEHGRRGIDVLEFVKLAEFYHVSLLDLLQEEKGIGII